MSCHHHCCSHQEGHCHEDHHHCHSQCPCPCHHCQCEVAEANECADRGHKLLMLANEAWMEVLKEKIKDHIRKNDTKIDEIARIVSETNREFWHGKMAESKAQEHYENRLSELFDKQSAQQIKGNKKS